MLILCAIKERLAIFLEALRPSDSVGAVKK